MSFEGYYQKICPDGHYWTCDVYFEQIFCPSCGKEAAWSNIVDVTNGSFEDGRRIDGFKVPKVRSERKCEHCGSILERRFHVPKSRQRK